VFIVFFELLNLCCHIYHILGADVSVIRDFLSCQFNITHCLLYIRTVLINDNDDN